MTSALRRDPPPVDVMTEKIEKPYIKWKQLTPFRQEQNRREIVFTFIQIHTKDAFPTVFRFGPNLLTDYQGVRILLYIPFNKGNT